MVERYDRPLPRYTSYPTVPHWSPMGEGEVAEGLYRVRHDHDRVSIYVHIPFCSRMCFYCGCNTTVTKRQDVIDRYIDALCTEIDRVAERVGPKTLAQLHLGGGTPSLMPVEVIGRILSHIYKTFRPESGSEISMELDPTVTTPEHYRELKGFGFNRVSLGIQDMDDKVQQLIGRNQWSTISVQAFELARKAGFESINVDLLYGLPMQTPAHLERSARAAVEMGADRLAIFGYAHVPWMKPHQKKLEIFPLPGGEARWEMLETARRVLYESGYEPIGFDHFAKPNDELVAGGAKLNRNFQGYTVLEPMPVLAFGSTGIADLPDRFVQNAKRISDYVERIEAGGLAPEVGCIRTPEDEARRSLIVDLMCNMQLRYRDLTPLAGEIFRREMVAHEDQVAELVDAGLIEAATCQLRVTETGRAFLRVIASLFDGYLKAPTAARYSQAV